LFFLIIIYVFACKDNHSFFILLHIEAGIAFLTTKRAAIAVALS